MALSTDDIKRTWPYSQVRFWEKHPTKREIKIPSIMVYNDMNIIMIMEGAANFKSDIGVKCPLIE